MEEKDQAPVEATGGVAENSKAEEATESTEGESTAAETSQAE